MNRLPKHGTAVLVLLFGLMCVPASAAQVTIIAPADQDTIHDNSGNMSVEVGVEPPLDPDGGMSIRLLLDDKPAAPDSRGTSFALQGVERGEHRLQAVLIDRHGQKLSVSGTIQFTMWQASVNAPTRRKTQ